MAENIECHIEEPIFTGAQLQKSAMISPLTYMSEQRYSAIPIGTFSRAALDFSLRITENCLVFGCSPIESNWVKSKVTTHCTNFEASSLSVLDSGLNPARLRSEYNEWLNGKCSSVIRVRQATPL